MVELTFSALKTRVVAWAKMQTNLQGLAEFCRVRRKGQLRQKIPTVLKMLKLTCCQLINKNVDNLKITITHSQNPVKNNFLFT